MSELVGQLVNALSELVWDSAGVRLKIVLWAVLWLPALLSPLVGWLFAMLLAPPGRGSRWRRGAEALGWAPAVALALALLLRFVVFAAGGGGGGPAVWLDALSGLDSASAVRWNLAAALVPVSLGYALFFPLVCVGTGVANRMRRRSRAYRVPLGLLVAAVTLVGSLVSLIGLLWVFYDMDSQSSHALLDAMALLPIALIAWAIWAATKWEPLEQRQRADRAAPVQVQAGLDVVALWRSIGVLPRQGRALDKREGVRAAGPMVGAAAAAWRHAGAPGAPPGALDALFDAWREPDRGWLVPDLPDPTERLFLASALLLAIREHGIPCLVVTDRPEELCRELEQAMHKSGAWSCGPLVAGAEALRSAFAGGQLPAAAFLDVTDLSADGIRTLAGRRSDTGALWTRGVGLVFLSRVDRGTPLEVTHRAFVLQRLGLALRAREARWSVLATGFGGNRSRALVDKAFPGITVRNVPLAPRTSADVQVWLADPRFYDRGGDPWVKRAAAPVVQEQRRVSVGDPLGAFGRTGIDIWGADLHLVRDVALDGLASVSELDEAWLVAAFRSLGNRVPLEDDATHHALWGLKDNPVVRFLTRNKNLKGLFQEGELHPPRPLLGTDNSLVAKTHLEAALRECQQDVHSLEDVFGRALVEQVLGHKPSIVGHAVRRRPSQKQPSRVPLAPFRQDLAAATLRDTVTSKVMQIKHANSGEILGEVDRICAATRYYPGRVFAVGEHRYRVPFQAYDDKRDQILVEPVPPTHALTRPLLSIQVSDPTLVVAPQRFQEDDLSFHLATFEAMVREQVVGFTMEDNERSYEPITATYRTVVRGVFFDSPMDDNTLYHLARSVDAVLVAHLFAHEEDIEVFPIPAGFHAGLPHGFLVIDRFIRGMGVADALDDLAVRDVLVWVRAILYRCSQPQCEAGCPGCTPEEVLRAGRENRMGVVRALGVR